MKGCLHTQSIKNSRFGKINKQAKSVFLCPTLTIVSSTNAKTEETYLSIRKSHALPAMCIVLCLMLRICFPFSFGVNVIL